MEIPPYVKGHQLLEGKSVLITAAAGAGIGFATARKSLEEGCRSLFISDVHEGRLKAAQSELQRLAPNQQVYAKLCNVSQESDVQSLIETAEQHLDGIDVLFNNAGLGTSKSLMEMTDDEWSKVMDITLTGTMRMMRAVLPQMTDRRKGVIINNSSVLGWRAQENQSHYAAAKAGVMALTRCAALEVAKKGVRINAVAPSLAVHKFLKKSAPQELLQELESKEAFGRGAEVWEVANVMMFLASDYSSYMTGEIVSCSSQRS